MTNKNLFFLFGIILISFFLILGVYAFLIEGEDYVFDPNTYTEPSKVCGGSWECSAALPDKMITSCQVDKICSLKCRATKTSNDGGANWFGNCIPKSAPTCTDTIKNQDETEVDCGGSVCSSCPSIYWAQYENGNYVKITPTKEGSSSSKTLLKGTNPPINDPVYLILENSQSSVAKVDFEIYEKDGGGGFGSGDDDEIRIRQSSQRNFRVHRQMQRVHPKQKTLGIKRFQSLISISKCN